MPSTSQIISSASTSVALIADFPAELLVLIFKFLYLESRFLILSLSQHTTDNEQGLSCQTGWLPRPNILLPSVFPHAPASVCKMWRNVMSTVPPFWTRVVVFIDSHNSELSFARSQLEWSQGLVPIEIIITTRKSDAFLGRPEAERQRLRQVIDIVAPHVWRCQTLRYHVTYTSSLPRLATDFPLSRAPYLRTLELNASLASGLPGFLDGTECTVFQFPALQDLKLDGYNFVDLFKNSRAWFEQLVNTNVDCRGLSVSHYRPGETEGGKGRFVFHDALPILDKFKPLTLNNLDFDCEVQDGDDNGLGNPDGLLSLCDLGSVLTGAAVRYFPTDRLIITRCSLKDTPFISTSFLTLHNIPDPELALHLCRLLPEWEGFELTIVNCPGVDDTVLEVLGERKVHPLHGANNLNALRLGRLFITNCGVFTTAALRKMTLARRTYVEDDGHLVYDPDRFVVHVRGGRVSSEEDREWLEGWL